jgi:sRNA-binding carbon storage regulator CsrA
MLCLKRKNNTVLVFTLPNGEEIKLKVDGLQPNQQARLTIQAPVDVKILRAELKEDYSPDWLA